MKSKRQANFELLRIVAMLMIIVLHYLNKGELLTAYTTDRTVINYAAHLIEAFCIVAVNCYVLLSGYFLVESAWRPGRVVSLAPTKFKLDLLNSYGIETIQIDQAAPEKHVKEVFARFPYGVDAIVDATGSASVLPGCFRLLKKRGRLLQFSSTKDDEDITINPAYFYRKELH